MTDSLQPARDDLAYLRGLATAVGWVGSAITMGLLIGSVTYALVAAVSLFALFVGPGRLMLRKAA